MFYVYELIDPRDDKVFYVGKGKGRRYDQHVKDAKKGVCGLKCDYIREIMADGLSVGVRIARRFDNEDRAYAFEKRQIAAIGLENLTNIAAGGREISVAQFRERQEARKLARSMCRMARVLHEHNDVGFRFCGMWRDIPRDIANKMLTNGISQVIDCLGKSDALAVFGKYGVAIEING